MAVADPADYVYRDNSDHGYLIKQQEIYGPRGLIDGRGHSTNGLIGIHPAGSQSTLGWETIYVI
jgi:hypothetical protein